jgi:hypothetical protein
MILVDWDNEGRPRIIPGTGPPLLSDFLQTDVQDYWPRIEEISAAIEKCRNSRETYAVSFYGNVYELKLGPEKVTVRNAYDSSVPAEVGSFSEFIRTFEAWVAALRLGFRRS